MNEEIRVSTPAYRCPACNKAWLNAIYRGNNVQFYHFADTELCRTRFFAQEAFEFSRRLGQNIPIALPAMLGTFAVRIPEGSPEYDLATILIPRWDDRAA